MLKSTLMIAGQDLPTHSFLINLFVLCILVDSEFAEAFLTESRSVCVFQFVSLLVSHFYGWYNKSRSYYTLYCCCCSVTSLCLTLVTLWTAIRYALLSTISESLLKLMSIKSARPSNHFIFYHPLLLPSLFPSIRVFSNELSLCIRWPKYWSFSFSISLSSEYSGLISFKIDIMCECVCVCVCVCMGFPHSSVSKESVCNAGDLGLISGSGRSLEEGMATHSSILAWRIPWTEGSGKLQSMGLQRVRHN